MTKNEFKIESHGNSNVQIQNNTKNSNQSIIKNNDLDFNKMKEVFNEIYGYKELLPNSAVDYLNRANEEVNTTKDISKIKENIDKMKTILLDISSKVLTSVTVQKIITLLGTVGL